MSTPFLDRFTSLCAENDTTPNAVMLKTGLNTGNPTVWRKGRMPGTKEAKAIADYFGVTVDYLLVAEETEKSPEAEASELSDEALMAAKKNGEEVLEFEDWAERDQKLCQLG